MAYDLNSLVIRGRLVRDPEEKQTKDGKTLARFSIANNPGKKEDPAMFLDCTAWDRTAETARDILQKGDDIICEGTLKAETWQDKETGRQMSKIVMSVKKINIVKAKKWEDNRENYGIAPAQKPAARPAPARQPAAASDLDEYSDPAGDDDIPF
jgi:single-strand DNA-binding protein